MSVGSRLVLEFGRFGLVGLLRTILGLGLLYVLPNVLGIGNIASNIITYTIGLAIGFVLHRTWAFRSARTWRLEIIPYVVCFGIGWASNIAVLILLADTTHLKPYWAPIISMAVFTPVNYVANKLWTFRSRKPGV
jgi:putative flippase GtrA